MSQDELTKEQLVEALRSAHLRLLELESQLHESKDDSEWLEGAIKKRTYELNERVKELNCLYQITSILEESSESASGAARRLVVAVPQAWQHPQLACARIVIGEREFKSQNHIETPWRLSCDIYVQSRRAGTFEVGYISNPAKSDTHIFLPEEEKLLQEICRRFGQLLALISPPA
ncbi:MAG TPA: hypothetical protein PK876_03415 [Elusimicrobiota bacterium]|nr:hypothetical protein [Elusimicrobiota bacterium]